MRHLNEEKHSVKSLTVTVLQGVLYKILAEENKLLTSIVYWTQKKITTTMVP